VLHVPKHQAIDTMGANFPVISKVAEGPDFAEMSRKFYCRSTPALEATSQDGLHKAQKSIGGMLAYPNNKVAPRGSNRVLKVLVALCLFQVDAKAGSCLMWVAQLASAEVLPQ
jgi:hypothetical protein